MSIQVAPTDSEAILAGFAVRSQQTTPSVTLRINTCAAAGREVLKPLLLEFLRRYLEVRIDLVTEGNLVDIVEKGFDFGIRSENLVPSDMIGDSQPSLLIEGMIARILEYRFLSEAKPARRWDGCRFPFGVP